MATATATATATSMTLVGLKLGGTVVNASSKSSPSVRGGAASTLCVSTLYQSPPCNSPPCNCCSTSTSTSTSTHGGGPALGKARREIRISASASATPHAIPSSSYFRWPRFTQKRNEFSCGGYMGRRRFHAAAAALVTETSGAPKVEVGQWTWDYEGSRIVVHFQQYGQNVTNPAQTLLMLPTLSDVSTTDEWQAVAEGFLRSSVGATFKVISVDWPGLGLSERPPINYTADVLEKFLADFMSAFDGLRDSSADNLPVIVGAGHSATIAARALSKGLVQARALVAVAPTWAGPLPIVFGRDSKMEFRYNLLRNTLRSPGIGWAMYKYLVSSEKNIRMQYLTHVYADADNVTPAVVESRAALTQRDGARFAPAAFLTGLLDPTTSRAELLGVFSKLDGTVPTLVMSTAKAPKRSRAEMEALEGAAGVTGFVTIPGALLPHEEYPDVVTEKLLAFLQE